MPQRANSRQLKLLLVRFSEHFEFKAPEEDTVFKMVREWIDGKRVDTPFHESFTPEAAAKLLNGMSPADIRDRCSRLSMLAYAASCPAAVRSTGSPSRI